MADIFILFKSHLFSFLAAKEDFYSSSITFCHVYIHFSNQYIVFTINYISLYSLNIFKGKVAEEHFGGFLTQKNEAQNWKDRMAELISQTKKEKGKKN